MIRKITLETDRFKLKPLTKSCVTARYLSWFDNKEAKAYIENHPDTNHPMYSLKEYVCEREENPNVLFFGIYTKDTNEHIGNVKYEPVDQENKYAVMGILIGETSWRGKGVAREVIIASSEYLFLNGINKVLLGVGKSNHAAISAYTGIGFKEGKSTFITIDPQAGLLLILDLKEKFNS